MADLESNGAPLAKAPHSEVVACLPASNSATIARYHSNVENGSGRRCRAFNVIPFAKPSANSLDRAQALAAKGFRVFPLIKGGKTPAVFAWNLRASTDPDKVAIMFSSSDPVMNVVRIPEYNIGIACGKMGDGRFLNVVDVDVKNGGVGRETIAYLDAVEATSDDWLDTMHVTTWSGGDHYYFVSTKPFANSASKIGPSVDTRGQGGYVVAPGSSVEGSGYTLQNERPMREMQPWLEANLSEAATRDHNERDSVISMLDTAPALDKAGLYLRDVAAIAIEGQGGDHGTYKVAAAVKDFGVSEQTCLELMLENWNDRCEPPWDPDELATKVFNAYAHGTSPIGIADASLDFAPITAEQRAANEAANPAVPPTASKDLEISRFKFEWFGEIKADLKRRDLIKGIVLRVCTLAIIGAPGTGKSQLEAHLAHAIASGSDWCGHKVMQGAVICALGEGAEGFRGRVQALRSAHGGSAVMPFIIMPMTPNLLSTEDVTAFVTAIKAMLNRHRDLALRIVFVDTLTTATPGMDQNSTEGMSRVVSALRYISNELDCVAAVIHHVGKDATRGARGSSVLNGDLDTELLVEVTGPNRFVVKPTKQRDFEKGVAMRFVQRSVVIGQDADCEPVTAVFAEHDTGALVDADDFGAPRMLTPSENALRGLLINTGWLGRTWLREAFVERWLTDHPTTKAKDAASTFRRVAIGLVGQGLIQKRGEGILEQFCLVELDEAKHA